MTGRETQHETMRSNVTFEVLRSTFSGQCYDHESIQPAPLVLKSGTQGSDVIFIGPLLIQGHAFS